MAREQEPLYGVETADDLSWHLWCGPYHFELVNKFLEMDVEFNNLCCFVGYMEQYAIRSDRIIILTAEVLHLFDHLRKCSSSHF